MYVCCVNKSLLNSFLIKKRATARGIPKYGECFGLTCAKVEGKERLGD